MIGRLKNTVRRAIEAQGYFIRPTSQYGFLLGDDIQRLLAGRTAPRIFDVGANAGQWLGAIKRTFPAAQVHCYEPDSRAFAELQKAAAPFADVECVPCALGAHRGRMQFFRNADSVTSSLLEPAALSGDVPYAEKLARFDSAEVEVRSVADEMQRLGLDRLDLLKTDCQGFDLQVLAGAAAPIETGRIDLISVEALFHREYQGQAWFHEILAWLTAREFALVGVYDMMHDACGRALFADALFVRRGL